MNYKLYALLLLVFQSGEMYTSSLTKHCIKKVKSLFSRHAVEKIDHKELSTTSIESISIHNTHGSITIKTGWKKNYLCLKTTKRAKNKTDLDTLKIIMRKTQPHHLSISTQELLNQSSSSVEYELIIPASLNVNLKTKHGNIIVNDIQGSITTLTHQGDITIINATNSITAESTHSGSICIVNADHDIHTTTARGNITITDASDSIVAHAKKGKITIAYKELPTTSSVALETLSGNISLVLPTNSHATINGLTTHGTIISEHFITLKPYTTQLNSLAWNKLKKELHGTIGSGDALISFSSLYGNVRILETKTT